jgi:hypothetical protein
VTIGFDPDEESVSGNGWVLTSGTEGADPDPAVLFATLTDAATAQQDLFSASDPINSYLLEQAEETVLSTEQVAVDAELEALRVAEGLDATLPP